MKSSHTSLTNKSSSSEAANIQSQSELPSVNENQFVSSIPVLKSRRTYRKASSGIEEQQKSKSTSNKEKSKTRTSLIASNTLTRSEESQSTTKLSDISEPGPSNINLKSTNSIPKLSRRKGKSLDFLDIESKIPESIEIIEHFSSFRRSNSRNKHSDSATVITSNLNSSVVNSDIINGSTLASHKYTLRSHSKLNILPKKEQPLLRNWQPSALGASTSQNSKREDSEPSRLTRSGAVLRRSTRNNKCK